jgi:NAD(P)-dependent dehydrogenase (short-subunit alcohol dehydrogenase family)
MTLPDFSLNGKVALITGARQGIGKGIALTFAQAGADVVICGRTMPGLEEVADEIRALGHHAIALKTDVSIKSEVQNLVATSLREFNTIDVLVNNAVVYAKGWPTLVDLPEDEWDNTVDVGLKGYYLVCQAVSSVMIPRRKGSIINMGSTAGIRPTGNQGAYSVIKAGCMKMTELLATELGQYNIRVNSLAPTNVKTPAFIENVSKRDDFLQYFIAQVPLGRVTELSELTAAALFLASDASSSISGHTLVVDGGRINTFPRPSIKV